MEENNNKRKTLIIGLLILGLFVVTAVLAVINQTQTLQHRAAGSFKFLLQTSGGWSVALGGQKTVDVMIRNDGTDQAILTAGTEISYKSALFTVDGVGCDDASWDEIATGVVNVDDQFKKVVFNCYRGPDASGNVTGLTIGAGQTKKLGSFVVHGVNTASLDGQSSPLHFVLTNTPGFTSSGQDVATFTLGTSGGNSGGGTAPAPIVVVRPAAAPTGVWPAVDEGVNISVLSAKYGKGVDLVVKGKTNSDPSSFKIVINPRGGKVGYSVVNWNPNIVVNNSGSPEAGKSIGGNPLTLTGNFTSNVPTNGDEFLIATIKMSTTTCVGSNPNALSRDYYNGTFYYGATGTTPTPYAFPQYGVGIRLVTDTSCVTPTVTPTGTDDNGDDDGNDDQDGEGPTLTPTATPVPGVTPALAFKVKFQCIGGTNDRPNQKTKLTVVKGDFRKTFENVNLEYDNNGAFSGSLALEGVTPGNGYCIIIKGSRQLARKFCQNNQTTQDVDAGAIVLAGGSNTLDFTGLPLEGGDLPAPNGGQDGVVNSVDYSLIQARMLSTNDSDLAIADINADGAINGSDQICLRNTLETKYEEKN